MFAKKNLLNLQFKRAVGLGWTGMDGQRADAGQCHLRDLPPLRSLLSLIGTLGKASIKKKHLYY